MTAADTTRSRRSLLAAVAAAGGAFVARAFGSPTPGNAFNGDTVKIGQTNNGTLPTIVRNTAVNTNAVALKGMVTTNATAAGAVGVWGESLGFQSTGVFGHAPNGQQARGVWGRSQNGRGVYGLATATSGINYGVYGESKSNVGVGVRGSADNGTGGVFETKHADRYGLHAQQNAAGTGSGAAIRADGNSNLGVYGTSTGNWGVWGYSGGLIGVSGTSDSGTGVSGFSTGNIGVSGTSNGGYGVYGLSDGGHAGHFNGTCFANSFETPAPLTVRIDHPLEPARQVLSHATVVSDQAATMYSGTATTDEQGEATVELPSWFGALNRDVLYQLTTIGDARAWIARRIEGNHFTLATDKPNVEVCWQLSGVRQDAYAKAHPLVVESKKTGREKGKHLNPIEHGQPESKGVDYELRQQATKDLARPAP